MGYIHHQGARGERDGVGQHRGLDWVEVGHGVAEDAWLLVEARRQDFPGDLEVGPYEDAEEVGAEPNQPYQTKGVVGTSGGEVIHRDEGEPDDEAGEYSEPGSLVGPHHVEPSRAKVEAQPPTHPEPPRDATSPCGSTASM